MKLSHVIGLGIVLAAGCRGIIGDGDSADQMERCQGTCVGASGLMRLTRAEYAHSVEAAFDVVMDPTALPLDATAGPFAANDAPLTENDAGAYHQAAWSIAEEVAPALAAACDAVSCVAQLLDTHGPGLFRRPITDADRAAYVALFDWSMSVDTLEASVELVVATMLQAPDFLYRVEHADDSATPTKLSGDEVANRLALFLWQEGPDAPLRDAAVAGELDSAEGVREHARRMLDDPRAERAIASFHSEWLGIAEGTDDALGSAMRQETERFAIDVFRSHEGSLEALFTHDATSIDDALATHYGVAVGEGVVVPGHVGILTHASVLSRYASTSYTRPVRRGDMLISRVLCFDFGTPPADALDQAEDTASEQPDDMSDREKLAAVTGGSPCNTCHSVINPAGYVFENFDELGRYRAADANGAAIDASGSLRGIGDLDATFDGPQELMPALATSDTTAKCLGEQWLRFAVKRVMAPADSVALAHVAGVLAETGDLRELLVAIAGSDAFRFRLPRKT